MTFSALLSSFRMETSLLHVLSYGSVGRLHREAVLDTLVA